ncbi:MAG: replication-relaxation family protein [Thermoleophilaceae bacterium]
MLPRDSMSRIEAPTTRDRPTLPPGMVLRQPELGDVPIVYDRQRRRAVPQLQARDLEIMRALWRYDFLTTSQIGFEWWAGRHPSRPQIRLAELSGAGLLARFRPIVRRGTHQWIYQLARDGFRAAQRHEGPDGTYVDEGERWSDRWAVDMRRVQHQLRASGWMLAYRHLLGAAAIDWLGSREARAVPESDDGEGAGVAPDAALLIELDPRGAPLELLVELAREERPARLAERLRRYAGLLSGGWQAVLRPRRAERPPAVVFVARGYRDVDRLLRAADGELVGDSAGEAEAGMRERVLFCAEPDLHTGSLRAWVLPPDPPAARSSREFRAREVRLPGRG